MKKLITLILLFASIGLYSQQVLSGDYIKLRPITLPYGVLGELAVQSSDSTFQFYNGTEWVDLGLGNPILEDVTTADTTRWGSGGSGGVGTLQEVTTLGATSDKEVTVDKLKITDAYGVKATHKIGWNDGFTGVIAYEKILELSLSAFQGNTSALNDTLAAYPNYKTIVIDTSITMTEDWTIQSDMTLKFIRGSVITTGAYTITGDYTAIDADLYQTFSLTSNVEGTWTANNGDVYVEWFGAKGDGTGTADAAAIQKALEVFCIPDTMGMVDFNYYDKLTRWYTQGIKVKVTGSIYNIEKTIEFPPFGNLEIGHFTTLYGGDGFYDPFIEILSTPYWIDGGRFLVRRYEEQTGYTGSGGDAEKIQYAYNKHPVFRLYLNERLQSVDNWGTTNTMYKSTIQNVEIKMIKRYTRQDVLTPSLLYSAFFISSDTTQYTSGTLDYQRSYTMVEYHTGDDFSNVTTDGAAPTGGFLINIPSAAGISGPYPETVTPNDWSNGSIVEEDNGAYFQVLKNIHIDHADTGIYIQGAGEGVAGWTMENLLLNGCRSALYIGDRAWQNIITGLYIQASGPSTIGSEVPQIEIKSSQNYITGGLMDMYHDSTIYIKPGRDQGTGGNRIELTTQGNVLLENFTKYSNANLKYSNPVGPTPMWLRAPDNTWGSTSSAYWFNGTRMGIAEYGNTTVDKDVNPRSLFELVGETLGTTIPLLSLQTVTTGYSSNNTVDNMSGFSRTAELGVQAVGRYVRPGQGAALSFVIFDTINEGTPRIDAEKYEVGLMGFRQVTTLTNAESGIKSNFQIWQKTAGTWYNSMTIDETGRIGFNGVTNPAYTMDLDTDGTFRSESILDDGTGIVEITGGLLNIDPLTADPATAQPEGTMWINTTDNTFNISINGGVYSIDLTAKP